MSAPGQRVIDREWIARHIPHHGTMCLIDSVQSWDDERIVCVTRSHLSADNPLRAGDGLGIANAIEYAAQAMAVHSALLQEKNSQTTGATKIAQSGYLTSVRDVRWYRPRLNDIAQVLTIGLHRFSGNELNVLYDFEISAAALLLIEGRASVMLNAGDAP